MTEQVISQTLQKNFHSNETWNSCLSKFKNKRTRLGKYKTNTYKKAYIKLAEGKEINMENPFK